MAQKQGRPISGRQYGDMKIEEAILFLLAKKNGGMTTDQLADEINRNRLVVLNGGKPVSSAYVYSY